MNGFPSAVTRDRRLASFFTRRNGVGECRFTPREALISSGFERARLQPCRKHCKIDGGFSPAARYLELAWWLEDQVFAAAAIQPRNLTVSSWLLSWRQPFSPEKPSSPEPSWPKLFSLRSSSLEASSRRPFWPAAWLARPFSPPLSPEPQPSLPKVQVPQPFSPERQAWLPPPQVVLELLVRRAAAEQQLPWACVPVSPEPALPRHQGRQRRRLSRVHAWARAAVVEAAAQTASENS
jgi:hypothetical protein